MTSKLKLKSKLGQSLKVRQTQHLSQTKKHVVLCRLSLPPLIMTLVGAFIFFMWAILV
jgi:hypothetical protein